MVQKRYWKIRLLSDLIFRELLASLRILPIRLLKPHEDIDPRLLNYLREDINRSRMLRKAILVDSKTLTILDGHHRVVALKTLGYRKVPCLLIDYSSPRIEVASHDMKRHVTKESVLKAALKRKLLPPKSSKHFIRIKNSQVHVSEIEPEVNMPLKELR